MTKTHDQRATLEQATSPKLQWGRALRNAELLYLEQWVEKSPPVFALAEAYRALAVELVYCSHLAGLASQI